VADSRAFRSWGSAASTCLPRALVLRLRRTTSPPWWTRRIVLGWRVPGRGSTTTSGRSQLPPAFSPAISRRRPTRFVGGVPSTSTARHTRWCAVLHRERASLVRLVPTLHGLPSTRTHDSPHDGPTRTHIAELASRVRASVHPSALPAGPDHVPSCDGSPRGQDQDPALGNRRRGTREASSR